MSIVSPRLDVLNGRFAPRTVIAGALLALAFVGCAQTRKGGDIHKSGFLVDYSMLKPGTSDEAQLIYIDQSVDFSKYDSILLENVSLWIPANPKDVKVSVEDRKRLSALVYQSFHDALKKDCKMVTEAGPTTLRIRIALTDAEASDLVMDNITSILPQTQLIGNLYGRATDAAYFVGKAGGEIDVTDSVTGRRLFAAVDERIGLKRYSAMFDEWHHVDEAIKYWAERAQIRLGELRAKGGAKKK